MYRLLYSIESILIINDESERLWKEAMLIYFKVQFQHPYKPNIRMAGLSIEIWALDLQNTKQSANHSTAMFNNFYSCRPIISELIVLIYLNLVLTCITSLWVHGLLNGTVSSTEVI